MVMMRTGSGIRRLRAERTLFEVHARLAIAREQAQVVAAQHAQLKEAAEEARVRMLASETALAHRCWEEARRHADATAAKLAGAQAVVSQLEATQAVLFDELLV